MVNTEIRLIIFFAVKDGEALYSQQKKKKRPGADCGSDHEFLIAKFRLKLKKVGETTRPFRYDLNQIPNNYTVEVKNRFKGLDLIDRVPDESKMAVWGGLTNSCEKKRSKKQWKIGKLYPSECRIPKYNKER